jgi:hypothetical protein
MTDKSVLDTLTDIQGMLDKIQQEVSTTETPSNGEKRTHVAFVLDESGSMGSIWEAAIDGFNEQVNAVKENADKGGDTTVSQWRFGCPPDARPKEIYFEQPVSALLPISQETYQPFGMTPMYDGLGMALTKLEPLDKAGDVGFLIVLVSDGQENASKEWDSTMVASKIKQLQDTGRWTFVYIGANHDLADVSKHLGIPLGNMVAFAATNVGTRRMSNYVGQSTATYMDNRQRGLTQTSAYTGNEGQVTYVNEDGTATTTRKARPAGDQKGSS